MLAGPSSELVASPTAFALIAVGEAAAGLAGIAAAGAGAYAALSPQSQLFGHTLIAGNDPAEAALTFDDGPNDRHTLELLEVLARHNARATFFMVGQHARARPELVRAVAAAGHLIGNHTETHPWLTLKPSTLVRAELTATNAILEDLLGAPVRFFRPPHGARRPAVLRIASELGLTTVQWNAMGQDWRPIGPDRIVSYASRGMAAARRRGHGVNLLLHDGDGLRLGADRAATVQATDVLLTRLRQEGTRTVRVDAWAG